MIVKELKQLSTYNLNELHTAMQLTVEHNKEHAIDLLSRSIGVPASVHNNEYYCDFLKDIKCRLDSLD